MSLQIVGHLGLQMIPGLRPLLEERVQPFDLHEQMGGRANLGLGARQGTHRIDQVGRTIRRAAFIAAIAVLVGLAAFGTGPFHEPIGQKLLSFRIE